MRQFIYGFVACYMVSVALHIGSFWLSGTNPFGSAAVFKYATVQSLIWPKWIVDNALNYKRLKGKAESAGHSGGGK